MAVRVRLREIGRVFGARTAGAAMVAAVMCLPATAGAQETRAEEIAAKQKEKAAKLAPYRPGRAERFLTRLEENFASPPNGFYPEFGSIYPGGGLSVGLGYRRFYAREAVWNIRTLYSIKAYKQIEVGTQMPWHTNGPWTLGVRAGWLDAPQIGYFGVGMLDDAPRANFHLSQTYLTGSLGLRPSRWTRFQAEAAYEDYTTKGGRGRAPSIETIYNEFSAPGLLSDPAFIRAEATAAIDWRVSPNYARRGGYYGVTLANYTDRGDRFSFQRLDGEIIQHLPILRENWVISLRGRVQSILDNDDEVPFFLLPQLGSGRTLRAYQTGRFRDRHSILTSAEFRWIPNRTGLDMAVFYDAGKVTRRRSDLDFSGLKSNWGIGARFHGPTMTVLRIEAARGSAGWHLIVATTAPF
jgi:hypothetical protein